MQPDGVGSPPSPRPLRALHCISFLGHGGIEQWLLSMLRTVDPADLRIDVLCKGRDVGPLAGEAVDLGATIHHVPLGPGHVRFLRGLRRVVAAGGYDVVHNHFGPYAGVAVRGARAAGVAAVSTFHNTEFPPQLWTRMPVASQLRDLYGRFSIRYALRHSDLVTGVSRSVLAALRRYGPPAVREEVLPHGVAVPDAPDAGERARLRAELGWEGDSPVVLHVGRFLDQKNHPGVIAAFDLVHREVPAARLALVGDGPLRPRIEAEVARRGLADAVAFLGIRDRVPELMARCDVFLFPSLHEGFGLVALEANAAGLPVVGSRLPALEEAVADGETALLFPVDDTDGMAQAVVGLLHDSDRRGRIGAAGRQRAQREYSVEASAARMLALYRDLPGLRYP